MLMEWLEPMLDRRINEATDVCDNDLDITGLYDNIMSICDSLQCITPTQLQAGINRIEKMINARTRKVVEVSYRLGFGDGLGVKTEIKKCL